MAKTYRAPHNLVDKTEHAISRQQKRNKSRNVNKMREMESRFEIKNHR